MRIEMDTVIWEEFEKITSGMDIKDAFELIDNFSTRFKENIISFSTVSYPWTLYKK